MGVRMNQFTMHPFVYSTGKSNGLINLLENIWNVKERIGKGTLYIISGFGNYNGGVRFYSLFSEHIRKGGKIVAFFGGSTGQRLTSIQVVEELLNCGVEVNIINRKRILHAKCYGYSDNNQLNDLVVTSGNFTGPGMSQNVESAIMLDHETVAKMNFKWDDLISNFNLQKWDVYSPDLADRTNPAWKLLYDEVHGTVSLDDSQEVTMVITLGHADTVRINADFGTVAQKGTQYFWLSKDCYDFFPALNIRNQRGTKPTYSAFINMNYLDIGVIDENCRVTFESGNNLDFRLGTGKLRGTKIAGVKDLAAITRKGENDYELRIITQVDKSYNDLKKYAINFCGHQGKQYGYIPNVDFFNILGTL